MIWTISDLHLSFAQPKPMDIFGSGWKDHPQRIADAWRARVAVDDWVLVAGDISWAMKLAQVRLDLEWIAALPGRKVLIRGNHDYWCPRSVIGFRRHLPPTISLIGAGALDIGPAVVCGTRGWITPETPGFSAADQPIYERELLMLERALAEGLALAEGRPLIVMIHFPPFVNRQPSEFSRRIAAVGATSCLYGHLHRRYDWDNAVQGTVDGVSYQLTSCDYLGFGPVAVRGLQRMLEPSPQP